MMIVLERMENVVSNANMTETRLKNWKRLINRLDKVFSFTSRTESDPDIFAMLVLAFTILQFRQLKFVSSSTVKQNMKQ